MDNINVGRCIKIAQAINDVKNIDLARHFDVKPQQVIRWRNSEDMNLHRIQNIAKYFEMNLIDFLGLEDARR